MEADAVRHRHARDVERLRQVDAAGRRVLAEAEEEELVEPEEARQELGQAVEEGLRRRVVTAHALDDRLAAEAGGGEELPQVGHQPVAVDQEGAREVGGREVVEHLVEGLDADPRRGDRPLLQAEIAVADLPPEDEALLGRHEPAVDEEARRAAGQVDGAEAGEVGMGRQRVEVIRMHDVHAADLV